MVLTYKCEVMIFLVPEEMIPNLLVKSKLFIHNIMFLRAVTHTRHYVQSNLFFGRKIDPQPFIYRVASKRLSWNRTTGKTELKSISATNDVYRDFLLSLVFQDIRVNCPWREIPRVVVQHESDKPHLSCHSGNGKDWWLQYKAGWATSSLSWFKILDLDFLVIYNLHKMKQVRKMSKN